MFGSADFMADLGVEAHRDVLAYPRARLVVAFRSAGLPPPVDGPCLATNDTGAVEEDARDARRLGMGGKLCIHPAQVVPVNKVFSPTADELTWARSVLEAAASSGGGAFRFDGQMVDEPSWPGPGALSHEQAGNTVSRNWSRPRSSAHH